MRYNLKQSIKTADVWHSKDAATWQQIQYLQGDFYAQNTDVVQPGSIAPWYERYGHSLSNVNISDSSGMYIEYMVLLGGYSPEPSNDIWITTDGITWVFCGMAPWSARAWHSATMFSGSLWVMGGTPLNNEVWRLTGISPIPRRAPLTRSMFVNTTYNVTWERMPDAGWSPRVGMSVVSHWYHNYTAGQSVDESTEQLVLIGGYGGWPSSEPFLYDGIRCREDSWMTLDGHNWTLLNSNTSLGARAWAAAAVLHNPSDPRLEMSTSRAANYSSKIFLFGGGYLGNDIHSSRETRAMDGRMDAWWSRDGGTWYRINFQQGSTGGSTAIFQYSTQEWARTTVDSKVVFLGMWGMTVHAFNAVNGSMPASSLVMVAGDRTGLGGFSNVVYQAQDGLMCDMLGVPCTYNGVCGANMTGCVCNGGVGEYCYISLESADVTSAAYGGRVMLTVLMTAVTVLVVSAVSSAFYY